MTDSFASRRLDGAGLTVENANIKGMGIPGHDGGYDVEAWIRELLARDGCHLD